MSQNLVLVRHPNEEQLRVTRKSKVVLVGDSSVGKSSIAVRFTSGIFRQYTERTIGANFFQRSLQVDETVVRLDIWDTAGQERFRSIAPLYYRKAQAAIVVFDVTERKTFEQAVSWVSDIRRASPNTVLALAGNKSDISDGRVVYSEEVEAFATENRLLFMETSAKTGLNIDELFLAIAERLPQQKSPEECPKEQEHCTIKKDEDGQLHVAQDQWPSENFGCCWKSM